MAIANTTTTITMGCIVWLMAMYCKACGDKLGDPQEDLNDPEGEFIPDLGVIENDDAHIDVIYRDGRGSVLRCNHVNEMGTKVLDDPPGEDPEGQPDNGSRPEPQPNGPPSNGGGGRRQKTGEVYDLPEDKDAMDLLEEVISNPVYGLDGDQIKEVLSWGDLFDGQIPPQQLEEILSNLSGISNQKAQLMTRKYEASFNKWIKDQTDGDSGPTLGVGAGMTGNAPVQGSQGPTPMPSKPQPKPSPQPQGQEKSEPGPSEDPPGPGSRDRRTRRQQRRQEAIDEAAEEFAFQFANNAADDAGIMFREMRDLAVTLFKKKAESDPEWFFEKAEKWDMDLFDEVMKESEHKRKQDEPSEPSADVDVDQALEEVMADDDNTVDEGKSDEDVIEDELESMMGEEDEENFDDEIDELENMMEVE